MSRDLAKSIVQRINVLGRVSDDADCLTRTFASPAMRRANDLISSWMRQAGMTVRKDAIGNLIGHYPGAKPNSKILLLGSHLDTVRDAGKFDGPLGVLTTIACVQHLHDRKIRLPFAIEVIGFADEEGVRFQTAYLGSKAMAGILSQTELKQKDADGVTMGDAIKKFGGDPKKIISAKLDRKKLLGYAEVHIEQGPVLEKRHLSVGVVSAIAGQSRVKVTFTGRAGHAGTVPMKLRLDALCAAAEFILAVESHAKKKPGLVATVGEIQAKPGASNVIPGEIRLSLDVRHANDAVRKKSSAGLKRRAQKIATARGLKSSWERVHEAPAVDCDARLTRRLGKAVKNHQRKSLLLPSGAGHDAAPMSRLTPVTMLFVRCKGGVSHHPDESASLEDIEVAVKVMNDFVKSLSKAS